MTREPHSPTALKAYAVYRSETCSSHTSHFLAAVQQLVDSRKFFYCTATNSCCFYLLLHDVCFIVSMLLVTQMLRRSNQVALHAHAARRKYLRISTSFLQALDCQACDALIQYKALISTPRKMQPVTHQQLSHFYRCIITAARLSMRLFLLAGTLQ
jgi:hypothetical protein